MTAATDVATQLSHGRTIRNAIARMAAAVFASLLSFASVAAGCGETADLPIEFPHKINLALNLTTAKSIGLSIPKEILLRADVVFE